jgi:hypothetical protein
MKGAGTVDLLGTKRNEYSSPMPAIAGPRSDFESAAKGLERAAWPADRIFDTRIEKKNECSPIKGCRGQREWLGQAGRIKVPFYHFSAERIGGGKGQRLFFFPARADGGENGGEKKGFAK